MLKFWVELQFRVLLRQLPISAPIMIHANMPISEDCSCSVLCRLPGADSSSFRACALALCQLDVFDWLKGPNLMFNFLNSEDIVTLYQPLDLDCQRITLSWVLCFNCFLLSVFFIIFGNFFLLIIW